jgi:transcriptional regulator with XRE-family HTH domain
MIGDKIRELRESKEILLRQLAAQLDMDTALLSKMERGDRFFRKEDIVSLSKIFNQSKSELLTIWLADKVLHALNDEQYQIEALELALTTLRQNA